jgi:uncharacterized protein (TIGR02996 family)
VSERKAFLKALADNEDDPTTRLVYADWLDERGEHEEAERQRNWPAAKAWLVRFCEANNPPPNDEELIISYEVLIKLGRGAAKGKDFGFHCGNNMDMCDALRGNSGEFWRNWSIVTGIAVPPDVEEKSWFRCAC